MKRSARLLFLALVMSAGMSYAQLPPWERFKLNNGLEVLVVENHLTPIVTINLVVKNGSFTEPDEYNGLSHLYEHMFFTANERDTSEDLFLDRVDRLGISYNGETHEENVQYYFTLPKKNLERGLDFMATAIKKPLFKQRELDQQIAVVLGEFDRNESNPYFNYNRKVNEALWGEHISRKVPLGTRPTITAATREKMFTIQKKYYIPNNSLLIVAGDVDTDDVEDLVEEYFEDWQEGPDPFKNDPVPTITPLRGIQYVTDYVEQQTSVVFVRWHGPSIGIDDKATYAADVFSEIIRQDEHPFTKDLLETNIARGRNFWYYTQRLTGPIQGDIYATPDKLKEAMGIYWKHVEKFTDPNYYTDEELETAKAQLRSRILYDTESLSEFTKTVAFWWASTSLDYYEGYLDNLAKVNRSDIKEYVEKYMLHKPYVIGLAVSPAAAQQHNIDVKQLSHDNYLKAW